MVTTLKRIQAINDIFPKLTNVYLVYACSCLAGLIHGTELSSLAAFLGQEQYLDFFNNPDTITTGGINSSIAGGSFLGCIVSSAVSEALGRRLSVQVGAIFWVIGAAIQCSSRNVGQLVAGRVIGGIGVGFTSATASIYSAECAPKKIRGLVASLYGLSIQVGMMLIFYISYGCSFIKGPSSFRTAWGIQMIPGVLLFLCVMFLPESPRWLANHGEWEEAERLTEMIHANGDPQNPAFLSELEEMKVLVKISKESAPVTYADLFRRDSIIRTLVGVSAQSGQQLTGMMVMMYYIVYIFKMAGMRGNTELVSSSIEFVLAVVVTFPSIFLYDRVGRRPIFLFTAFTMAVWLFTAGALMAVYSHPVDLVDGNTGIKMTIDPIHSKASKAIIACCYLFVATWAPSWGPGIWVYTSEIFPVRQRSKASGFCVAFNWLCNFAIGLFVPTAFKTITWKTYMIFATFCGAWFLQVFFLWPETKGRTQEEIELIWRNRVPAWKATQYIESLAVPRDEEGVTHEGKGKYTVLCSSKVSP